MNQVAPEITIDDDEIDIGQIIKTLWNGKWLIILVSIITGGFGVAYAIMATPIYEGNALLQIEAKSASSGLPDELNDILSLGGGGGATSTELELLVSRKVIAPAVKKFNLEVEGQPFVFPLIGNYFYRTYVEDGSFSNPPLSEYFSFLDSYAWGGEQIIVNQFDVPENLFDKKFEIIKLNSNKYSLNFNGVEIFEGNVGHLVHIDEWNIDIELSELEAREGTYFTLMHKDPILSVDELVENLIVGENGKTSGIVEISLQGKDKTKIKNIINYILSTYQAQNIEYNNVEAGKNLDFMAGQLPNAAEQLKIAEEKIYEYRLNNETVNLNFQSQQLLNQLLSVEKELNTLKFQEIEISRKFKRQHPVYIEFLRKKSDLEQKKSNITTQTAQISTEQYETFRLERDVELAQTLYLQMVNRYESLKVIKAGTSGSIRVIDDTIVHPKAVKPKKLIIAIVSTFVGIIIAMAYLLLRSMVRNKIENVEQLKNLGFTVYALIGESVNQKKLDGLNAKRGELRILAELKPEDSAVEALRGLRTNLCFTVAEADNNVVMITGASPSVGKSFVAQNLAALLAQTGKKTLLVDVDLRRGKLHEAFGADSAPGLVDYLSGDVEFTEVCRETRIKNLDIITCGQKSSYPSELLMSEKFTELCTKYQQDYDFIILDTSPILAVTDAAIVGKLAATSIMVVRQSVSQLKEVELATQRLTLTGIDVTGYVFNGADKNQYEYSY